jgi:hypothetical protein
MTAQNETEAEQGLRLFKQNVWPAWTEQRRMQGGIVISMETQLNIQCAAALDSAAGIDLLILDPRKGLFGMALRTQYWGKSFGTFIIRKTINGGGHTEYEKRLRAIESGGQYLSPWFTCQSYYSDRTKCTFLGVAIAKTAEIIMAIKEGRCTENKTDNATFYIVDYGEIESINIIPGTLPPEAAPHGAL